MTFYAPFCALILSFCLALLTACGPASESGSSASSATAAVPAVPEAVPVEVQPVRRESIAAHIQGTATLESDEEVQILAEAAGRTTKVLVEEGDRVESGQILAQLDDREARLGVQRAQVQLAEARLAYNALVRLDQREARLALRGAEVEAAEAREHYRRAVTMAEAGLISQEELDAKRAQKETAEVALEKQGVNLEYKTIDDARFRYERAKTELQEAKLRLQYTTVKAPMAGVVSRREIVRGQFVQKNQHLFTLVDPSRLLARTFLPEKFSGSLEVGQTAYIETEALPEQRFAGRVKLISPVIEADSGTFKVTVELAQAVPALKPGMFTTVLITTATHDDALVIPKRALTLDSSKPTVYRLERGRARRVTLKLGLSDHDRIEVLSGLQEGEQIVVIGQEKLLDDMRVKVVAEENESN